MSRSRAGVTTPATSPLNALTWHRSAVRVPLHPLDSAGDLAPRLERQPHAAGVVCERQAVGCARHRGNRRWTEQSRHRVVHRQPGGPQDRQAATRLRWAIPREHAGATTEPHRSTATASLWQASTSARPARSINISRRRSGSAAEPPQRSPTGTPGSANSPRSQPRCVQLLVTVVRTRRRQ